MRILYRTGWVTLIVAIGGGLLSDSIASMVKLSLEQLTKRADTIVLGTVSSQTSAWNVQHTAIYTSVTVQVETVVKGSPGRDVTFQIAGGSVDDITMRTSNDPVFQNGERVVVFFNTASAPATVVGLHQGKYSVKSGTVTRDGRTLAIDDFLSAIRVYLSQK